MKRLLMMLVIVSASHAQGQSTTVNRLNGAASSSSGFSGEEYSEREDTLKTYHLPEIVVTATRLERNLTDVGRSITVISRAQLRNFLYTSVAEALSQHEGLYVVGVGQNPGMLQSIFLRGAANNQTAILIDDVRITDPSSVNNALDASELSFTGFDRIEIVRGSHSTLYGTAAIGGVINIITQKNRTPGIHAEAVMRTGFFGKGTSALSEDLALNYTDPAGLYVNAEISNARIHGLDATVDTVTNTSAYKKRDLDGFNKRDALAKVGFRNEEFDVYASYRRTNQKVDIDKGAFIDDDNSTVDFARNLFTYGASYSLSDVFQLKYIGGYTDLKRVAIDDSSVVDGSSETDHTYSDGTLEGTSTTNEFQGIVRMPGLEGVLGAGFYRETMTTRSYFYTNSGFGVFELTNNLDSLGLHSTTSNLFAHFDLNGSLLDVSLRGFSLAVGARSNHHSSFGNHLTYEINPSLHLTESILFFASYSTGFNAPSLYQLFSPDKDFTSGITRGNRYLQPETSASYEVGWKQSVGEDVRFSVSYFRTGVKNSIEYAYLWDKDVEIDKLGTDWLRNDFRGDTYLNVGEQITSGLELALDAKLNERLHLSANFSLLKGTLKYRPSEISTIQTQNNHVQIFNTGAFISKEVEYSGLVRRPNTANASVTYNPLDDLSLKLDIRYAGSRNDIAYDPTLGPFGALARIPVGAYTLVDFSQHLDVGKGVSLNSRVENLFDTKYAEINGFTTRGRGFYLSLRYGIDHSL